MIFTYPKVIANFSSSDIVSQMCVYLLQLNPEFHQTNLLVFGTEVCANYYFLSTYEFMDYQASEM